MTEKPASDRLEKNGRFGSVANSGQRPTPTRRGMKSDLVKLALLPLLMLGGLFAGLVVSGVLPLTLSPDKNGVLEALFLGPVGVVITGKDPVKLRSENGQVTIAIAAGSVSFPVLLSYQESDSSGTPSLPHGYLSTGRFFELSAQPERAADGPVKFQQMLSITVGIGPDDLALAGNDYSRFALQHFLEQEQSWDVLKTTADPANSTIVAWVDNLSRFALTVGPGADVDPLAGPQVAESPAPAVTAAPEQSAAISSAATPIPVPTATALSAPITVPPVTAAPEQSVVISPTASPIPVATATALPTPVSVPAPSPTPGLTATPGPAAIKLHGYRLYINGVALQPGQTNFAIANGKVVLSWPPDDDGTYPPDSTVPVLVVPAAPGAMVMLAGFRTQSGQTGYVYMNLDRYVSVLISSPVATPTPTPRPSPTPAATPGPSPTPAPGSTPTPTPLPYAAGGRVAFQSDRSGNFEVMIMGSDGYNPVNLTNNPASDAEPSWCGGDSLAFASDRDGNWEIYIMSSDGTNQTRLTDGPAADNSPDCSPSGDRIAYTSARDGNDEIYVMNADGSNQQRLTTAGAADNYPAWSPDGSKIAFVSDRDGNSEIYLMNADGTGVVNLTNDAEGDTGPAWSPGGGKIAFASNRNGSWEIYLMNSDGSGAYPLTANAAVDGAPSWNAAGSQIVFHSNRDGNDEVYRMSSDGSFQTNLTNHASADRAADWER